MLKAVAKYSAAGKKMDEATVDKFQMKLFSKVFGPMIKEQVLFALFTKSEKKVIL